VKVRKELRRGLVALVLLACIGALTYATLGPSSTLPASARNAIASRLKHRG
jgi:hypothetical protein